MQQEYMSNIKTMFEYYKHLGTETIQRIPEDKIHWQFNDDSNSVAIIVKHLWGNMLSRWTDFLTSDGEKTWRQRDQEFENDILDKKELLDKWNEGWNCLFHAIELANSEDLDTVVYIRNQGHSIIEAFQRQLGHYSYHIGQLVFLGKMIQAEKWVSLSIPKNASQQFNDKKFDQEKHRQHFTDEFINRNKS